MADRVFNFSAGPAVLPEPVLKRAQDELMALPGHGMSVLEISHRGKKFGEILEAAKANLRELLAVPAGYSVLFLQGGGVLQFSMIPLNFSPEDLPAHYIVTGSWGKKAANESKRLINTRIAFDAGEENYRRVPTNDELDVDPNSAYAYFTSNETIQGVQFADEPDVGDVPLICDASSDFMCRPLPIERYALIYACAQKNAGPAGVTIIILRDDLLSRCSDELPGYLDYRNHVKHDSMFNTPPTFGVYMVNLVALWLKNEIGGLGRMHQQNRHKASMLYDVIDSSNGFYSGHAQPKSRSIMNVTFRLPSDELQAQFISGAEERDLYNLKGHRSVGGIRASIYNSMPVEGVERLRDFMREFADQELMTNNARILVLDRLADEGLARLQADPSIDIDVKLGLDGDALREALASADVAICRSGVKIDAAALEHNTRLKAIIRAGVGTDNIDKPAATRRGIIVMNTPAANTISTAEHTMALLLGLSRNLGPANRSLRDGRWDRKQYVGTQLHGKTLGIIGLGRIGREVASRAMAFGMRVLGHDSFLAPEKARELGIEPVECLDDLLPQVDFLTVHTPLTPETKDLLDAASIERMRPGSRVINCARGGIYNEQAVAQALVSDKLAGAAFDVYETEPCTDSPLFDSDKTLCTPHLGASTEEAQTQVSVEAVELALNFLSTGEVQHAVNAAVLDRQTLDALRGHLNMTYRLGHLLAGLHEGHPTHCNVCFRGDIASKDTRLLDAAFCAGLIERAMDEPVNIVNSEMLLSERGIETSTETHPEQGAFRSSVYATIHTAEGHTTSAAGTLFGNDMPRLIQLDDFRLEAFLDGVLLVFHHKDMPGVVGQFGTVLGNRHINIAQMAVGRSGDKPGGDAIGILNLDSKPDAETLELVRQVDGIDVVRVVELPSATELPAWLPV